MDTKKRIEIELKPGSYASKDQLPVNENLNALLQNEYATRYLESIAIQLQYRAGLNQFSLERCRCYACMD